MSVNYELCDHTRVPQLARQFTDLSNIAFAEYDGAMEFSYEWGEWYLARPGTDRRLCQAGMRGDQMVSQVLVAMQDLQIGGEVLRCGIIDSVATLPEHRKQGLARGLMGRAHDAMREIGGADAAVLYTNPAGHPYKFYGRLGYLTRATAALITGRRPDVIPTVEDICPEAHSAGLMSLLNTYHGAHEGYAPLTPELWHWHKLTVPESTGLRVMARSEGSDALATVSFAEAQLLLGGERREVCIAYDLAAFDLTAESMAGLLAASPREWVAMIVDVASPEARHASALGLDTEVGEAAMILPWTDRARSALQEEPGIWYPMIESLIGV